jgi:flavin reductase (DIM6/NTAB) family NADH-FMN oxidoreductase RutF
MILEPFLRGRLMPLPVTFISTISKQGIRNIAPWSCVMPVLRPLDLICVASAKERDTLRNIRDTGQFVLNLAGADLIDKVIPTARHTPPEIDEFDDSGLAEKPSKQIQPPGIAGCYAWMECELVKLFEEDTYVLIMGKVVQLELSDAVLGSDGFLDVEKAQPLLMAGGKRGMHFCTVKDLKKHESFSAMFPNGKDPLGTLYADE